MPDPTGPSPPGHHPDHDGGTDDDGALAQAERALGLVDTAPAEAERAATVALARAVTTGDREARSVASRALGLARREAGDLAGAEAALRRAVQVAERAGLPRRAAQARISLTLVLAYQGRTGAALREADRAEPHLEGGDLGRLLMQRSLVLQRLGHLDEALDGYRRALRLFRRSSDTLWQAYLLLNRSVALTYRGALAAAQADLREAEQAALAIGRDGLAAKALHNRGFVAGRAGDVPAALALLEQAEARFAQLGLPQAVVRLDRCEVLLAVRLFPEARRAAELAADELAARKAATDHAEALLLVSQTSLLDGDPAAAATAAEAARTLFARQGRRGWLALAHLAALRAAWGDPAAPDPSLDGARRTRRLLEDAGLPVPALEAGLIAAGVALAAGRHRVAATELAAVHRLGRRGPAELRARAWHAAALLRLTEGNRQGADAALRAGVRALQLAQATLGASELRASAGGHADQLACLGLQLARESGDARRVLAWAERCRAAGLRAPPARPADDERLAADLAELRQVVADVEAAALTGRDSHRLLRRQAALELAIANRTRQAAGGQATDTPAGRLAGTPAGALPTPAGLFEALAGRALVEVVEDGGTFLAVALAGGRTRLAVLGSVEAVTAELDGLRFALRRLAPGRGAASSLAAAAAAAAHAAARLDDLLLGPLRAAVADRPLVVVPTGRLHALPWPALPSCRDRPVTVAPSAALWLRAEVGAAGRSTAGRPAGQYDAGGASSRAVLVAGPGLPGAAAEVEQLARRYPEGTRFSGADARAADVTTALEGAEVAHIAAHGTFRGDNPQFSALLMADGPLTVYDLEALHRPPHHLVLSACDSGVSAVRPGNELMGLSAALLSLGTAAVVASVGLAPDRQTEPLMLAFHDRLLAGDRPSAALAAATAALAAAGGVDDDPSGLVLRSTFVCFGAG
ncbi:MAG: CHAT domain-containing protein [Acidimicrobiales bacterium]